MARVRFKGTVITRMGSFGTGDLLECSDDFAAHLVNDCGAAEYVGVVQELAKHPIEVLVEDIIATEVADAPKRRGRPPKVAE